MRGDGKKNGVARGEAKDMKGERLEVRGRSSREEREASEK